jgi:hypothetical protein
MTYVITTPIKGQPASSALFGQAVKAAILDLDTRVAKLEGTQQVIVKRGRRITSTGNITTTETGWLRLDNIPVLAGNVYQINTTNINVDTSVDNDIADVKLRVAYSATTGTLATITSTLVGHLRGTIDSASISNIIPMNMFYMATANGYISLILTLQRVAGTGNIIIFATGADFIDFVVQFGGPDPGDTGVVL